MSRPDLQIFGFCFLFFTSYLFGPLRAGARAAAPSASSGRSSEGAAGAALQFLQASSSMRRKNWLSARGCSRPPLRFRMRALRARPCPSGKAELSGKVQNKFALPLLTRHPRACTWLPRVRGSWHRVRKRPVTERAIAQRLRGGAKSALQIPPYIPPDFVV